MRRLLPLIFLFGMLIPVAITGWLGLELADNEQAGVQRRFEELLAERLRAAEGIIDLAVEERRNRVATSLNRLGRSHDSVIEALTGETVNEPIFLLDRQGGLVWPDSHHTLSDRQQGFLVRTRQIWEEHLIPNLPQRERPRDLYSSSPSRWGVAGKDATGHGWYGWHWQDGLSLLYWQRLDDGYIIGREVEQLGLLATVIARLPSGEAGLHGDQIRLMDARGRVLYQWGGDSSVEVRSPDAALTLRPPLGSWHLEYFSATPASPGAGQRIQILSGLAALTLVLVAGSLVLYRELTRAMREAAQRVNFVNQVSHELKTPLTNIRLYAELLQDELETGDPAARRAEVIVNETARLSRLIGNILNFARKQRNSLALHLQPTSLDDCVRVQLEQFTPGFTERRILVQPRLAADTPISIDPDAVMQIIGNLLSNVEKYGSSGGRLEIETRLRPDVAELVVQDHGPGVPQRHRHKLFRPFYRVRNDLTEGVSGTGIGLSIARDLARMHGGDLRLLDSAEGARFLLMLPRSG